MNIKRKLEIADAAIRSISRHDDEDTVVLNAALDKIVALIDAERVALADRQAARIAEQVSP